MKVDKISVSDRLIEQYEKHFQAKAKRKLAKMKVSGASVKNLTKIIKKKER